MKSALASATKSSTAIAATSTTQATNNHHHHHNNNNNNNIMTSSTSAEPTSTTTATATTTTLPQHNNTLTNDPHDLVPLSPVNFGLFIYQLSIINSHQLIYLTCLFFFYNNCILRSLFIRFQVTLLFV